MYDFKENSKRNVAISVCFIVLLSIGLTYFLCRRTDVSDVRDTVERSEQYNQRARDEIGNASNEIESATNELDGAVTGIDRSTESIIRSQESVKRNQAELDQCQQIISEGQGDISEARRILESVRQTGKGSGTQKQGS